jgi:large subunit ribosomal protein L5
MQVPKLDKITVNMAVGEAKENEKLLEAAAGDMTMRSPARSRFIPRPRSPSQTSRSEKDMPIGCKVTLRGDRMYEFLDRLVNLALPRVRDFRGVNPNSFDGRGNYALGIKEQIIFPEIEYDKVDKSEAWISSLPRPQTPTRKQGNC